MNGTSWTASTGFGQPQQSALGLFGASTAPSLGPRSTSAADLGSAGGFSFGAKKPASGSAGPLAETSGDTTGSTAPASASSGLFGYSSTGHFFASTSGTTATQGGFFGNSTTAAPASVLFGAKNASAAQPSGLFGSSNQGTSLFGSAGSGATATVNAAGTAPGNASTSLFGGPTSSSATPASNGGLFGSTASNPSAAGGLFGAASKPAAGLFGNSITPSTGLFGGMAGSAPLTALLFGQGANVSTSANTTAADPYKAAPVISDIAAPEYTMPQSITAVLFKNEPANERLTSQTDLCAQPKKSSLLGRLAQTFNVFRAPSTAKTAGVSSFKGIFTQQNYINDVRASDTRAGTRKRVASPHLQLDNRNIGDVRKLVIKSTPLQFHLIDADRVLSAKRRRVAKPLTAHAYARNVLTDDESDGDAPPLLAAADASQNTAPKDPSTPDTAARNTREIARHAEVAEDPSGYFCSPSFGALSAYSVEQLSSVDNFIIGRKGHGQIAYSFPVDLRPLFERCGGYAARVRDALFGRIIKIDNAVVRAYDDPDADAPPMGCELNLPATITLVAPPRRGCSVDAHIKRLQNITGMDFVTYDPILHHWTFRVKHFSVWGLIDDGDDGVEGAVDADEMRRLRELKKAQDARENNANDTYLRLYESAELCSELKRQKIQRQTSALPGGWQYDSSGVADASLHAKQRLVQKEVNQEINQYKEGLSALVLASNASDITDDEHAGDSDREGNNTFLRAEPRTYDYLHGELGALPRSAHFGDIVDEKAYEPEIDDDRAFDVVCSRAAASAPKDWLVQLDLANAVDSALAPAVVVHDERPAIQQASDVLFGDMAGAAGLCQASTPLRGSISASVAGVDSNTTVKLVQSVLLHSRVETRRNGFPVLRFGAGVCFQTFAELLGDDTHNAYAELVCILFERGPGARTGGGGVVPDTGAEQGSGPEPGNSAVGRRLEAVRQTQLFSAWLRGFYDRMLVPVPENPLEAVLLHVCTGRVKQAVQTALASRNAHLAALLTLLDANDGAVRTLARRQLDAWTQSHADAHIPPPVVDVHRILAGQYEAVRAVPLPDVQLALRVFYGSAADALHAVVSSVADTVDTPELKQLLAVYCMHRLEHARDAVEQLAQSRFNARFQWVVLQMCGDHADAAGARDAVAQRLARECEDAGLWKEAVAVAASVADDASSRNTIRSVVLRHVLHAADDERFLVGVLRVPRALIYEAVAEDRRRHADYWGCCDALVTAGLWERAHEMLCARLGPAAVIERDAEHMARFCALVDRFPGQGSGIPGWNQGAALFAKYFEIAEACAGCVAVAHGDVTFLLDNVAQAKVADNFCASVAFKIMSRRIGDLAVERRTELADVDENVAALKLGENERIYFAARLAAA
ncbi:hypothetical protein METBISCDRAFT_12798 [Metschnikowia bicuspidata]|uniref:Peptidase S59 domain-containing protein n=1 Tax=Metschnikowia bicuspidata TaxID=27322 RepID=A0A4P9ZG49_9ASCO|nr:hypothetical protein METBISCDRAFT_12798 [Metschnikowia bicuspidata]